MNLVLVWAWILNFTVIYVVAMVLSKIVLEIIDWTLRDRVEDYPGYEETGLSRKTWDRQPIEYKEKVWLEIKKQEKTI